MKFATRLFTVGITLALAQCVQADIVYGTSASAELVGSRNATSTITVNDTDWEDGVVTWNIVDQMDGTFTYTYTFTNFDKPAISHFTLDISDDAVADPDVVTGATFNGVGFDAIELGDKDGITGAAKFDIGGVEGPLTYSFTSNRSPVYGDFLLKAGSSSLATNTGFGDQTLMTTASYIPRPNGVSAVPEPSAFLYFGLLGLITCGWRRMRRRCP